MREKARDNDLEIVGQRPYQLFSAGNAESTRLGALGCVAFVKLCRCNECVIKPPPECPVALTNCYAFPMHAHKLCVHCFHKVNYPAHTSIPSSCFKPFCGWSYCMRSDPILNLLR